MMFEDRFDAGRQLAARLDVLRGEETVVLGLPRGGVPVAFEVAGALGAPLDVIIVRKLGVPFQPELGMGAIGEGNVRVLDEEVIQRAGVTEAEVAAVEARERTELERRARRFRDDHPAVPLLGRTAVVVDDGIATGSTARAACQVARAQGATKVVLAVPVAPRGWESRIGSDADELISLATPEPFFAIGQFYDDFSQTTDEEVIECLERARAGGSTAAASRDANNDPPTCDEDVEVQAGSARLEGHLMVPEHALGVVVFAHGSGSSRHSPRNQFVAGVLEQAGIGTLLFDLLTPEEELDRANVFDIPLLARRLSATTRWLRIQRDCIGLPVGFFGASTGAAAALWSAAELGAEVEAVVSRGGRPDLAGPRLAEVTAPTLLIVGARDEAVLALNREAQSQLTCESSLVVIPGATHLFEEPGTLLAAAETARDWFVAHLGAPRRQAS
ncbi:MAG: phosphoribosyltransferase family protein [Acidimicrobiales bacterium]